MTALAVTVSLLPLPRRGSHQSRRATFVCDFSVLTTSTAKHIAPSRTALSPQFYLSRRKRWSLNSTEEGRGEVDYEVLTALTSRYNDIVILDTAESRVLLLDSSGNVHSILHKSKKWTNAYWDDFATFPAIVPKGPIAILGLGGGTAAHLMLELWPSVQLEGWEVDDILIEKAREYLGLSDLEEHNEVGGALKVHIGDALSPSVAIPGGYAGIIVDLFSDAKVLPQLQEVATWLTLKDMLMPNGRIMVNCGAATNITSRPEFASFGPWELNETIKALCTAFPGQINWKKLPRTAGENYLALTGPLPDLAVWSACLPEELSSIVKQWKACQFS
ncbi:uncharacterized protein LOC115998259 [Ipomoea triloba]|uniref:uncharacterized protein LOC115998259 n=1 Tax=Ipomoea triloba TaxID=35885 RepID=UPI00125D9C4A|nr:uncharacterized protein LOC115998259 [Ipomoea triloba]